MYLRTTQRRNSDGSLVTYYQLAHNERDPETKKPIAKVIHNFGRADQLDRDTLVRLCCSIARVCKLSVSDPLAEGSGKIKGGDGLPEDLSFTRSYEYGPQLLIEQLYERLGIGQAVREAMQKDHCRTPYDRAILAMIANRLCEPNSKLGLWIEWLNKVYLPGTEELKLEHLYEAMDLLYRHLATIEEQVFFTTADLFNLDVDVIFYDTTTATFSIDEGDEDEEGEEGLRQYGRPKEGGFAPQVIVALAVTRDGLPVRSWVFPGNTTDSTTIAKVKEDLRGWKLGRALFVGDAGMNSADNRLELARGCGTYVLATRMSSVKAIKDHVLTRPGRFKKVSDNLHVKEAVVGEGVRRERYLLCYNPREAERQQRHRQQVLVELEQKLASHPNHEATQQWAIELKASGRYGKYLKVTKHKALELDYEAVNEATKYDGKWVVQTNDDTLTPADAAQSYKALLVIERCFRSLKTVQLHLTPMYHWVPRRIETHVKLCVLALLIERVAENETGQTWRCIRNFLRQLQIARFETVSHQFFERNEPSASAASVLNKLIINLPNKVLSITPRV